MIAGSATELLALIEAWMKARIEACIEGNITTPAGVVVTLPGAATATKTAASVYVSGVERTDQPAHEYRIAFEYEQGLGNIGRGADYRWTTYIYSVTYSAKKERPAKGTRAVTESASGILCDLFSHAQFIADSPEDITGSTAAAAKPTQTADRFVENVVVTFTCRVPVLA